MLEKKWLIITVCVCGGLAEDKHDKQTSLLDGKTFTPISNDKVFDGCFVRTRLTDDEHLM